MKTQEILNKNIFDNIRVTKYEHGFCERINSSIFFPFKLLVKFFVYMSNGFLNKHSVSDVSKREFWCDVSYILFLPIGKRHFEIGVNYCKDTGRKSPHVQEKCCKYTPHICSSVFPQACWNTTKRINVNVFFCRQHKDTLENKREVFKRVFLFICMSWLLL